MRLNRPDKMNAIDQAMCAALHEAGDEISADPSVRVAVLSGEGQQLRDLTADDLRGLFC